MGGMSTRNEIKARLGILAEPPAKATAKRAGTKINHQLGKVYVSPDHLRQGKFRIMPLNPDGKVNLNVYAQTRTLSFNSFEEAVKYAQGLTAHYGGTVESDTRGKSVSTRSGAKTGFAAGEIARIASGLSRLLKEYGFDAMAREAAKETDKDTLARYINVVEKAFKNETVRIDPATRQRTQVVSDADIARHAQLMSTLRSMLAKATASRPGAKSTHAAADKPGRKVMAESDPAVSAKIRKLMAEGKPQKQAVAIALDMKRRGEI
jgi:hypothetical protein